MNIRGNERTTEQAFHGLIIVAVGVMLLKLADAGHEYFGTAATSHHAGNGKCIYQVIKDGIPCGTVFTQEPKGIPEILAALDSTGRDDPFETCGTVPCKSVIRVDSTAREHTVEKMSGRHLLCAASKIDLNRGDEADLDAAPGIGPALAKNIIARRESAGPFAATEDLMKVPGIGPRKFRTLRHYVEVEGREFTATPPSTRETKPQSHEDTKNSNDARSM